MPSPYDVDPAALIARTAEALRAEKAIVPPAWAVFCKTGRHKERPPVQHNWWHIRCAALLRSLYRLGPIGVSKLRTKYGGKRNRGVAPEHFYKGSGSIIRKGLQQLEAAGLVAQKAIGVHKGRVLTPKGKAFLDKLAAELAAAKPLEPIVAPEEVAAAKAKLKPARPTKPTKPVRPAEPAKVAKPSPRPKKEAAEKKTAEREAGKEAAEKAE